MPTPAQIVARRLLRFYRGSSSRWTKGAWARRSKRSRVAIHSRSQDATCWCLSGALGKLSPTPFLSTESTFRHVLLSCTGAPSIIKFNDHPKTRFPVLIRVLEWIADGNTQPLKGVPHEYQ